MNKTLLCGRCPNNPSAKEKTVKLVEVKLEDFDLTSCEVCRCLTAIHVVAMSAVVGQVSAKVFDVSETPKSLPSVVVHS